LTDIPAAFVRDPAGHKWQMMQKRHRTDHQRETVLPCCSWLHRIDQFAIARSIVLIFPHNNGKGFLRSG
jgi:hypothetical protein